MTSLSTHNPSVLCLTTNSYSQVTPAVISKSERHYLAPLDFHTSDKAFRCRLPGSLDSTPKKQISYTSEDV